MRKKLLWALFAIITSVAFAEEIDISLVKDPPLDPGDGNGGKSLAFYPKASISSSASALSVAYPLDAVSVVQIVDKATDAIVYSGSFGATRLVVIDLEEEGLTAGNYRLRIFVFGEWWSGEFEI